MEMNVNDIGITPSMLSAQTTSPLPGVEQANAFEGLRSEDFINLMITQLTNQDPLEPTGNEELLAQISSIRDIELSTTLTRSLQALTGQQHFASASSLIGQHVMGRPDENGETKQGVVVAVRFESDGSAVLRLADNTEMSLDQVSTIEPPVRAAEALIGQVVVGLDRRDASAPRTVEGVVTSVRVDDAGAVLLELDSGDDMRFQDLVSASAAA